jgi:hypothetical protein
MTGAGPVGPAAAQCAEAVAMQAVSAGMWRSAQQSAERGGTIAGALDGSPGAY